MVAIVSFAVGASPLMKSRSPSESISSRMSLFRQVLIYAKEGSRKLVDGRWNLGQAETNRWLSCLLRRACGWLSSGFLRTDKTGISGLDPSRYPWQQGSRRNCDVAPEKRAALIGL